MTSVLQQWHHGGAHWCTKHIGGTFSGRKAKIDTTWSVPKCFPGCPVSCITVVTVIQWYFPSSVGRMFNVQKKQEFLETRVLYSGLPPWFIMKCWKGWLQVYNLKQNSLLNAKLIYMFALWDPDDMCHETWEPVFICTAKMLDSSTGLLVGALLKSRWSDHTTSSLHQWLPPGCIVDVDVDVDVDRVTGCRPQGLYIQIICSSLFLWVTLAGLLPLVSNGATVNNSSKAVFQVMLSPMPVQSSFEYLQIGGLHNFWW